MSSLPSPNTTPSNSLINNWLQVLQNNSNSTQRDDPDYYVVNPRVLITNSTPLRFSIGNGHQLLTSILPTCLDTIHELILVTCFWAKSTSREAISSLLEKLSDKALSQDRKIQVRICFSSRSITQKLFQTSSLDGKIYPSSSWVSLGLPDPRRLRGLNMVVKSVFVRPFSVMHPKFVLVDRQRAFVPSCNVSWESWFEGCIEMQGGVCENLFVFWERYWSRGGAELPKLPLSDESTTTKPTTNGTVSTVARNDLLSSRCFDTAGSIPTILLPSPHHINPRFSPFSDSIPPQTPLNTFLLATINSATKSIYMQTPNLTSSPVINALFTAIQRGISITIITSSRLMLLEQLVTAGTITEFEIWKLNRKYNKLHKQYSTSDSERQLLKPGTLKVGYYHPRSYGGGENEPVKSHLKLTIVDEEVVVLGSGNMDRASWYTSQELGVAFLGRGVAENVWECVKEGLMDRVEYIG